MHSRDIIHDGERFSVNHNGDFSGDVRFYIDAKRVDAEEEEAEVSVPFAVLSEFVASAVRDGIIAQIEDIEPGELFGWPQPLDERIFNVRRNKEGTAPR